MDIFFVSFKGQKTLWPRPDRSPLGVSFKISDEQPHPFHMEPLHPPLLSPGTEHSCVYVVASQLEESCKNDKY